MDEINNYDDEVIEVEEVETYEEEGGSSILKTGLIGLGTAAVIGGIAYLGKKAVDKIKQKREAKKAETTEADALVSDCVEVEECEEIIEED